MYRGMFRTIYETKVYGFALDMDVTVKENEKKRKLQQQHLKRVDPI